MSDDLTNAIIDAEGEAVTDTSPDRTRAQRAKFQIEFMLMMIISGRTEEASAAVDEAFVILDEMIEEGQ